MCFCYSFPGGCGVGVGGSWARSGREPRGDRVSGPGHWGGVGWCPEAAGTAGVRGHGLLWVLVRYGVEGSRVNTAWVPVGGIFLVVVWVVSGHGLIFRGKGLVQR